MEEAELQLIQTLESLEFALQSGRMGTWVINLETGSISCSKEMLKLWGVSDSEFKNQRSVLQSKVHPEDLARMNDAINSAIRNRSIYELEYRIRPSPDEERWVLSRGRCTYGPDSVEPIRFAGIVYDITERIERERRLARAVNARQEFITIAGHELKTPLTCLQLQMQVMEWQIMQATAVPEEMELLRDTLFKQQHQLFRITRIVENILDESKISEGHLLLQKSRFDLSEMVIEVTEQLKLTARSAETDLHIKSLQSVTGEWDRYRLEQVLLNLLMNAVRYGCKKTIEIEVGKRDDKAFFLVRDQGLGIKPEDQVRIFERFERANPEIEINGMGLGLFISKNIVRSHSGRISVKSNINEGAEFLVLLPCL